MDKFDICNRSLLKRHLFAVYIPGMSAQGAKYSENVHDVIWVTFHRSYTRTQREYDVAILGTRWTLQFSPSLLPVCLMDSRYSDSNTCES